MNKEELINKIKEKNINKAFVLGYFYNKVCLGKVFDNEIIFNSEVDYNLLTKIVIFNKDIQISYVLNEENDEFIYSEIEDEDKEYIDEYMIISGNEILSSGNGFTTITELGRVVDIPFEVSVSDVKDGVRLVVRNSFKIDDNKQVTLSESRLVGLALKEGVLYE